MLHNLLFSKHAVRLLQGLQNAGLTCTDQSAVHDALWVCMSSMHLPKSKDTHQPFVVRTLGQRKTDTAEGTTIIPQSSLLPPMNLNSKAKAVAKLGTHIALTAQHRGLLSTRQCFETWTRSATAFALFHIAFS